jgi:hypothetical protein
VGGAGDQLGSQCRSDARSRLDPAKYCGPESHQTFFKNVKMHTRGNCSGHFDPGSSHLVQVGAAGPSGRRGLVASRPISRGQRFLSIPMRCTIGAGAFDDGVFGIGNAARSLHQALDSLLRGWPRSLASNKNVIILAILCEDCCNLQHLLCFHLRFAQSESASHFGFSSFRPIPPQY